MVLSRIKLQTTNYKLPTAQSGQSLIETIVAIFILTTALTTGLGLAIYSFTTSNLSQNEIIASSLAREGVEVVRMMRDSNWLAGDASADVTYNLTSCADIGGKFCYPKAQIGPTYSISDGNWRILFNPVGSAWSLSSTATYNLYLQPDGTYTDSPNSTSVSTSVFARMINISRNTNAPYTGSNPELIVKSVVAWRGKNCVGFNSDQDLLALPPQCKVVVEEHMTNWKDYK